MDRLLILAYAKVIFDNREHFIRKSCLGCIDDSIEEHDVCSLSDSEQILGFYDYAMAEITDADVLKVWKELIMTRPDVKEIFSDASKADYQKWLRVGDGARYIQDLVLEMYKKEERPRAKRLVRRNAFRQRNE